MAIPDAKVEDKNPNTNATKVETSSAEGTFLFSLLPACRIDPGGVVTGNLVGTSIRPFLNTSLDLSRMTVRQLQTPGGGSLFRRVTVLNPIGNAGRGILRADGITASTSVRLKTPGLAKDTRSRFMLTSSTRQTRASSSGCAVRSKANASKIKGMTNFQLRGLSMLCVSALMQTGLMYGKEDAAAKRLKESVTVLQEVMDAGDKSIPQDLLNKAQCIVIVPGLKKGAFIIGAKFGKGFLSCRGKDNIGWTAPGAIRVEGGSVGFQIGGSEVDVIMLVLNPRGAEKLLSSKFTLGADATVAAGPVGRTSSAETDAAMRAEILTWSRSRGLFAGIALNGATLRPDQDANAELYGKKVENADIVAGKFAMPTAAAPLIEKLTKYSARK